MLSDEEKKELDNIKESPTYREVILLRVIEKQSKEIEELKKPKYIINCKTNEITKLTNDFVSKDKIKAKIEEVSNGTYDAKIVLQSLLDKE